MNPGVTYVVDYYIFELKKLILSYQELNTGKM